jgi:hypothetical protein
MPRTTIGGELSLMATLQQPSLVSFTTLAFCGVALLNTAVAAPPSRAAGVHGVMAAGATSAGPTPTPHLDLRPPTDLSDDAASRSAAEFPSSFHRQSFAALGQSDGEQSRFANLGAKLVSARTSASLEEFAQRVRRQGLPIARLWENKSALVSLGLNQRGKPGLWIMQKVH